jgi:hypothetical protein
MVHGGRTQVELCSMQPLTANVVELLSELGKRMEPPDLPAATAGLQVARSVALRMPASVCMPSYW